jgi:hypothetical protein
MTPNDFSDYYKTISNAELLSILDNQEGYQPLAIEAAKKEFEKRQLTKQEISEARQPLITKQLEKEKQKNKIRVVENKVRSVRNTLADTLNPVQKDAPTTEKLIRTISIAFIALFLFKIISDFRMLSAMIKDIARFDSSSFLYFLPFVILPLASVTFWMRKTIGWMLSAFFIIYSTIEVIWVFFEDLSWKPTGTSFDKLFPTTSPGVYIIQMLFLSGMLYIISKANIREVFKINRQRLLATLFMSGLVTVFFLLEF